MLIVNDVYFNRALGIYGAMFAIGPTLPHIVVISSGHFIML